MVPTDQPPRRRLPPRPSPRCPSAAAPDSIRTALTRSSLYALIPPPVRKGSDRPVIVDLTLQWHKRGDAKPQTATVRALIDSGAGCEYLRRDSLDRLSLGGREERHAPAYVGLANGQIGACRGSLFPDQVFLVTDRGSKLRMLAPTPSFLLLDQTNAADPSQPDHWDVLLGTHFLQQFRGSVSYEGPRPKLRLLGPASPTPGGSGDEWKEPANASTLVDHPGDADIHPRDVIGPTESLRIAKLGRKGLAAGEELFFVFPSEHLTRRAPDEPEGGRPPPEPPPSGAFRASTPAEPPLEPTPLRPLSPDELGLRARPGEQSEEEAFLREVRICESYPPPERKRLLALLLRYRHIFDIDSDCSPFKAGRQLPPRPFEFDIPVIPGSRPFFAASPTVDETKMKTIRAWLDTALARGWIKPSSSPWAAQIGRAHV